MISFLKKSIVATTVLVSAPLASATVYAADEDSSHRGTMGAGYENYLKEHPTATQNNSVTREAGGAKSDNRVLDISEWQGELTANQVKALKANYDFIIIRAQYGSETKDAALEHNSALLDKYNLDFGVYSYSMYENPDDARYEARTLHNRAPKAEFYVNDLEENSVTSGGVEQSTKAWYDEMKSLAGNHKVLFYSYENFINKNVPQAPNNYDGVWLANYNEQQPSTNHALWQYTDEHYSEELDQKVDANYISSGVSSEWFTS